MLRLWLLLDCSSVYMTPLVIHQGGSFERAIIEDIHMAMLHASVCVFVGLEARGFRCKATRSFRVVTKAAAQVVRDLYMLSPVDVQMYFGGSLGGAEWVVLSSPDFRL